MTREPTTTLVICSASLLLLLCSSCSGKIERLRGDRDDSVLGPDGFAGMNGSGDGDGDSAAKFEPSPAALRKLTVLQYRNSVRDLFPPGVTLPDTFTLEADTAVNGFVSIGAAKEPQVLEVAERLHRIAEEAGGRHQILWDDREESPGVKFTDAELLGMPWILTVSPRSLAAGGVEVTERATGERSTVPIEEVERRLVEGF